MKKILMVASVALALSTQLMAYDLINDNEDFVIRIGMDLEGSQNDARNIIYDTEGNPTCGNGLCGKIGMDKDQAYELGFALEKKVNDNEFGSRKLVTLYNYGDAKIHNGGLVTNNNNAGAEFTYEVFYKIKSYIKPYIGAGFGINRSTVDYEERDGRILDVSYDRNRIEYKPTLHVTLGLTGEIYKGFGYYATYKYRYADTSETTIPFSGDREGVAGPYSKTVKVDGVDGGQWILGLSYQF